MPTGRGVVRSSDTLRQFSILWRKCNAPLIDCIKHGSGSGLDYVILYSIANSFPFSAYPHGAISLIVSLAKRWPQSLVVCSDTPAANSIGSTIANRICRAAFHTTSTTILRMDEQATLFHSPLDSPIGMVDGVAAGGLVGGAGARIVRFPFLPSAVC